MVNRLTANGFDPGETPELDEIIARYRVFPERCDRHARPVSWRDVNDRRRVEVERVSFEYKNW
jgi:hypothetical protein